MGIYINPGYAGFETARAGKYVDKSGLIAIVNDTIGTKEKLSCVSRPRRFGKSMATQMLSAYYDCSCDSAFLFDDLEIARDPSYKEHLNKYNVLYLDITSFIGMSNGVENALRYMIDQIVRELQISYPEIGEPELIPLLSKIVDMTGTKFIAIIDEWDAIIRDSDSTPALQKEYLEFLRSLFKSSGTTDKIFAAAYMTGILPIKKDGSQSAISEFREYTMLAPWEFEPYYGFTETEVTGLCKEYNVNFDDMKRWYDGYSFRNVHSVYNPNSVMRAIKNKSFESYWSMSSSANSLLDYINMDFDGLAEDATDLLLGKHIPIEVENFQNDTFSFASKDDVLTILIHYGYLSYDAESNTVCIPNEEIRGEFARIIKKVNNTATLKRVKESEDLIKNTAACDAEAVAEQIEKIHREECSPLHYNSEQSLRSVIKMAYFAYRDYYLRFEELPSGNGYADIVFIPKKYSEYPALIIELKWQDSPETALNQIKNRHYPDALQGYDDVILLVGISYDKEKKHHCDIEVLGED